MIFVPIIEKTIMSVLVGNQVIRFSLTSAHQYSITVTKNTPNTQNSLYFNKRIVLKPILIKILCIPRNNDVAN